MHLVMESGAVPVLVALAGADAGEDVPEDMREDVRKRAVSALGNMAGGSPRCRDAVLAAGLLPLLLELRRNSGTAEARGVRNPRKLLRGPRMTSSVLRLQARSTSSTTSSTTERRLTSSLQRRVYLRRDKRQLCNPVLNSSRVFHKVNYDLRTPRVNIFCTAFDWRL